MALTPTTLQAIITAIRQRTNMENNQFVTDSEITTMANQSLSHLDSILVAKFNDYKINTVILSPNASAQLACPLDFLKLRAVDVQVNASDPDGYLAIKRYNFQQRIRKPYLAAAPSGYGPSSMSYRLQGEFIQLEPIAIASQWSYRVWYTPDYILLVNPTDTLQQYMDSQAWYELAVVDCCAKILAKQDLDASVFLAQKAELVDLITKLSAPNRDAGEPAAMVDTRGWAGGNGSGYGWDW